MVAFARSEGTQKLKQVLLCFLVIQSPTSHATDSFITGVNFGNCLIVTLVAFF